jgi:Ca-activated chloride channel family protein
MTMSERDVTSWKLLAAIGIAIASAVALSSAATIYWMDEPDKPDDPREVTETDDEKEDSSEDSSDQEEKRGSVQEPKGDPEGRQVYELPDHSGRMVGNRGAQQIGLPQVEADYDVHVRGDLASVVVEQSFENPTDMTLEPTYQFPLYEDAAVYDMTMQIGDRVIESEVQRKEQARETYEKAKEQGKKAALLEQDRPNLFTQKVANVEPGRKVEITLRYTHPVPKQRGTYRLTVPLAVSRAYTPPDMSDNRLVDDDPNDPGNKAGGGDGSAREAAAPESVGLSVHLDGGMAISGVDNYSHRVRTETLSETTRRIDLAPAGNPTDRHFRLGYRLAGDETRVGANSYWNEEDEQGYLDLLIEPPAEVAARQVPDREMVFVIDRSGSMGGHGADRLERARQFVIRALEHLRPDDRFRIISFGESIDRFAIEPKRATPQNIRQAKQHVEDIESRGGTHVPPALEEALEPEIREGTMRMVTVVTDVRVSNEFETVETVREHIGEARMFALGIGGNVNRYLLDELGRAGRGFSRQLTAADDVDRAIDDAVRRLQSPVLTDISIDWGGLEVEDVSPERIPDVYEGGSVRIHARYPEPGEYTVGVNGELGGEEVTFEKTVQLADTADDGKAVELGWARRRIEDRMHLLNTPDKLRPQGLDDETLREEITELGLDFSLSTQWTSFVAVADDESFASTGEKSEGSSGGVLQKERHSRTINRVRKARNKPTPSPAPSAKSRSGSSSGSSGVDIIRGGSSGASSSDSSSTGSSADSDGASIDIFGGGGGGSGAGNSSEPQPAAQNPPEATVTLDSPPSVDGDLSADHVKGVASRKRDGLTQCYEDVLDGSPNAKGRLVATFSISPSGDVAGVSFAADNVGEGSLTQCVRSEVSGWSFQASDNGEKVRVEYGFVFEAN